MARVLGEAGRFTNQTAEGHRKRRLLLAILVIGLMCLFEGMCLSALWAMFHPPRWLSQVMFWSTAVAVAAIYRWSMRKLDELEGEKAKWQRGDDGERTVGKILADLPDEFHVINDISTPSGNLDHVVVGPTGVFVVDAKNWRGLVEADGRGELMLNGEPAPEGSIGKSVARYMRVRDQVCALAPGTNPFLQGLFVFTSAWVAAGWGQTGRVNCLHAGQLWDYIEGNRFGEPIAPDQVKMIAEAFQRVAKRDPDFIASAHEVNDERNWAGTETQREQFAFDHGRKQVAAHNGGAMREALTAHPVAQRATT